ncbi:MAG: sensor histidine kinase [Deltaproteobacteria bacterium]|nr:sensor histidine kinase [Deltaproteobacteria bacterium]
MSELDRRIDTVSRTISAMGHALAGPLQSAMNTLFMARRTGGASSALEQLDAHLHEVQRRLAELMRLPELTRAIEPHHVPLSAVNEEAQTALGPLAQRMTVQPAQGEGVLDARAVGVAVAELAKNAFEAGAATVELRVRRDGNGVRVELASASAWTTPLAEAVDPFHTTKANALGLGLPIAQAVAVAHRGRLEQLAQPPGVALILPAEEP